MDQTQRLEWDEGIVSYTELAKSHPSLIVAHVVNRGKLNFKNRDFVEKRISFESNGIHYIYISYVDDQVFLILSNCKYRYTYLTRIIKGLNALWHLTR